MWSTTTLLYSSEIAPWCSRQARYFKQHPLANKQIIKQKQFKKINKNKKTLTSSDRRQRRAVGVEEGRWGGVCGHFLCGRGERVCLWARQGWEGVCVCAYVMRMRPHRPTCSTWSAGPRRKKQTKKEDTKISNHTQSCCSCRKRTKSTLLVSRVYLIIEGTKTMERALLGLVSVMLI